VESTDMRAYARSQVCCPADLFHAGASLPEHGFVTELSEGGAFVQTRHALRRGDRVFVRFTLDHEEVAAVSSEVAWVRRFEPVNVDGQLPGAGVRFLDLDPEARSRIRYFLKKGAQGSVEDALRVAAAASGDGPSVHTSGIGPACDDADEPLIPWHDTDVDEDDLEAGEDEGIFVGAEPDIGEPSLEPTDASYHEPQRERRPLAVWLAAGSLALGIGAGAAYGALAPDPVPANEPGAPGAAAVAATAPDPASVDEVVKPAAVETVPVAAQAPKPVPSPAPRAAPVPAPKVAKPAPKLVPPKPAPKPTPAKAAKPAATSSSVRLAAPARTSSGWYITLVGVPEATEKLALDNPPRAVIDLPPGGAPGLQEQIIDRGPFQRLRVGRTKERVRLVMDLQGVTDPSKLYVASRGGNLVIELPHSALASR